MRRLFLILALVLLCGGAEAQELAFLPRGGGGTNCPQAGPGNTGSIPGATIYPSTLCSLGPDQFGNNWGYGGSTALQTAGLSVNGTTEAQINTAAGDVPSKRIFYTGDFCRLGIGWTMNGNVSPQVISPSDHIPAGHGKNNTTSVSYGDMNGAVTAAAANAQIEILATPAGIPCWSDGGAITKDGITVTLDTGVIIGQAGYVGLKANIVVDANNFTLIGQGTATEGFAHAGVYGIKEDTGFSGMTVNGGLYQQAEICIDTGGYNGTTLLENLTVKGCGSEGTQTSGQTHNIYCGTGQSQGFDNSTCTIVNITSLDTVDQGHLVKVRSPHINISGSTIGCDNQTFPYKTAGIYRGCAVSYMIDRPCGGISDIHQSVIERPPNTFNFGFASFATELDGGNTTCGIVTGDMVTGQSQITNIASVPSQHGFSDGIGIACATAVADNTTITISGTGPYTFNLSHPLPSTASGVACWPAIANMSDVFNQDIFIDDGPSQFTVPACLVVNKPWLTYTNTVIKNSIIVFNPASAAGRVTLGCPGKLGVVDGGGNLCYDSRTHAFGAGHDFPYFPPPLTGNPVANGSEIPCPTS